MPPSVQSQRLASTGYLRVDLHVDLDVDGGAGLRPVLRADPRASPSCRCLATPESLRLQVDRRLAQLLPPDGEGRGSVAAAMRDGVLAPGKRLRPLLMLVVGGGLGGDSEALLDLACAVEMVHAASLVLDDLPCMDNARLRRGRPAIHVRHGEDVAVLAAVALLTQAYGVIAAAPLTDLAGRSLLVRVLSEAVGWQGLVRGQFRDLREGRQARPLADIASTNAEKTGALFVAALEMAAIAAGAGEASRTALRGAACDLGHAFQLRDDLDDLGQAGQPTGKDIHQDEGKSTMVALLGAEAVRHLLAAHLARAEAQFRSALPDSDGAVALLRASFTGLPARPVAPGQRSGPELRAL
jgi:geranylgeranyl diphosphate synthase, type II